MRLSIYTSICLSVLLSIGIPVFLFICLSVCLCSYQYFYLSIYLSVCLSRLLSTYLFICNVSICPVLNNTTYFYIYLPIYHLIYPSFYLSACLLRCSQVTQSISLSIFCNQQTFLSSYLSIYLASSPTHERTLYCNTSITLQYAICGRK